LVHLIGSLALALSLSGLTGFLAFPFLAYFGWFYIFVEFFAVLLQWALYLAFSFSDRAFKGLFIVSGIILPVLAAAFAGSDLQWALGFGIGTAIAGVTTLLALRLMVYLITYNLERRQVTNRP
jgi:hypothetical protein